MNLLYIITCSNVIFLSQSQTLCSPDSTVSVTTKALTMPSASPHTLLLRIGCNTCSVSAGVYEAINTCISIKLCNNNNNKVY